MKSITKIICLLLCVVMLFTSYSVGVQAAAVKIAATEKLTAEATADTVKLTWKKVSKATGYRVYRIVDGKLKTLKKSVKSNKYTVEELTAGETYKFAVKTYRTQNGKTYWSSKYKSVTVKTKAMSTPKKPTATSTKNTVTLKWNEVPGATGYRVYQYKNGEWAKIKTLTAKTLKVSSLKENKTYKFKIRPYAKTSKKTVWGKYSSVVTIQTVDKTKAKFTTPVVGSNSITLYWGKVANATGYRVNMLVDGEWVKVAGGIKGTKYQVKNLDSNKEYTFMVRAYKTVDGKVKWFTKSDNLTVKTKKAEVTTTKPTTTKPTTTEPTTTKPTTTKPTTTTPTTTKPTTTKPTTTKPTTQPTTTKPTTTEPTTTKPTTTQPTTTKPTTTKPTTTKPTTTKPTTTEPTTTKPTTTKPTTTKPTTTKPTTTKPTTTQPTEPPAADDLTPFRIEKYKKILEKDTIFFKISSEYSDDEVVPVTFARKNGNMYMSTTAEGLDMKLYYDKSDNKMLAYVQFIVWVYYEVPKNEMADMDMTEMLEELQIGDVGDVIVTRTKFNNKSVIKESFYDSKTGYTMNYYFDGETLVGIIKQHPKKVDETIYVEEVSNTVSDDYFEKPKGGISLDAFEKLFG